MIFQSKTEELTPKFRDMTERIFNETAAFKEIEDTVGKDNILRGFSYPEFPTKVEFNKASELDPKNLGSYNLQTEKIKIKNQVPDQAELWSYLTYGFMPEVVRTIDHELTHFWYHQEKKKPKSFLEKLTKRIEIFKDIIKEKTFWGVAELTKHAFKLAEKLPSSMSGEVAIWLGSQNIDINRNSIKFYEKKMRKLRDDGMDDGMIDEVLAQKADEVHNKEKYKTTSIIKTLVECYGYNKPTDIDKIILASKAIDSFRALGFSDREIVKEFSGVSYDSESVSFPLIEKKLQDLLEEKGISENDLDYQVDLMRIEKEIHMLEAADIAQEELKNFAKEKESRV